MKRIQQVSIKGLLCRDNKVLFLKTSESGKWELPGGRMVFGESVEDTFQREMKEEMGFTDVEMGKFINAWFFTSVRKGINYHFIIFDFEIFSNESKIKLSDEHVGYKWIGKDEFDKFDMREGHKETLRKFFNRR